MRRRRATAGPIEPPAWYRVFHLGDWDEPDGHERSMIHGCAGYSCWPDSTPSRWRCWPQWLHVEHARRRWLEARYEYCRAHPELAAQEFQAIVNGEREYRRRVANDG